jgi:formate hydrogenlyase subunit 3/multisubunit Na+/H+ antiporter MnhD subunit
MHNPVLPVLISFFCGGVMLLVKNLVTLRLLTPKAVLRITFLLAIAWFSGNLLLIISGIRTIASGGSTLLLLGGKAEPTGIVLLFDPLAIWGSVLVLLVGSAALFYALGKGKDDAGGYSPAFFFFVWFLLGSTQGVLVSRDLFSLFVFFEILAISAYILIAYKQKPKAILAGFQYLLPATLSISFYLIGVFILYRETGALSIALISAESAGIEPAMLALSLSALMVGIGTRMATVPFHGWLPEAHSIAAHPVSALLSGLVIKAPLVVLFRISLMFPKPLIVKLGMILLPLGVLSALWGVFMALQQKDAKKLLAYHSVSQMGYVLCAFAIYLSSEGAAAIAGAAAALFHAFNHGLFKSLLFLSVGSSCDIARSRNVYTVRSLRKAAGWWFVLFMVGAFSISGIPLFNGYASKSLVGYAIHNHPLVYALLLLVSAGTAGSFIKLGRIYFPDRRKVSGLNQKNSPNVPGLTAAALLGACCILLGVMAPSLLTKIFILIKQVPSGIQSISESFTPKALFKQAAAIGTGYLFYLGAVAKKGRQIAHYFRALPGGAELLLGIITAGFPAFWFFLMR